MEVCENTPRLKVETLCVVTQSGGFVWLISRVHLADCTHRTTMQAAKRSRLERPTTSFSTVLQHGRHLGGEICQWLPDYEIRAASEASSILLEMRNYQTEAYISDSYPVHRLPFLRHLQTVTLYNEDLIGKVAEASSAFAKVSSLDLTPLTDLSSQGASTVLGCFPSLLTMTAQRVRMDACAFRTFTAALPRALESLDIQGTTLPLDQDMDFKGIPTTNLRKLDISGCLAGYQGVRSLIDTLADARNLEEFHLPCVTEEGSQLICELFAQLVTLRQLKCLFIPSDWRWRATTAAYDQLVEICPRLRSFSMRSDAKDASCYFLTKLADQPPTHLQTFQWTGHIDAEISRAICRVLSKCPNLEVVKVCGTGYSYIGPKAASQLLEASSRVHTFTLRAILGHAVGPVLRGEIGKLQQLRHLEVTNLHESPMPASYKWLESLPPGLHTLRIRDPDLSVSISSSHTITALLQNQPRLQMLRLSSVTWKHEGGPVWLQALVDSLKSGTGRHLQELSLPPGTPNMRQALKALLPNTIIFCPVTARAGARAGARRSV